MKTIKVNTSVNYDVIVGDGILGRAGEICAEKIGVCHSAIVTDSNVDALYSESLSDSLLRAGYKVSKFVFRAGEESKSMKTLTDILEFLAREGLTRTDCVFALGGGVVGDIAGFASAVYLRGIRVVGLPTTLLAAVDSSVGGKTAVDLEAGKNLAGAFHQPSLVICDYRTLDTLDDKIFSDGCAEVIKYGIINDRALFEILSDGIRKNIEDVIARCVENKSMIVTEDEFDTGRRQLLNLGHTVGHAVELCSGFGLSHGEAVSIGTVTVMRAACKCGLCAESELSSVISLLQSSGLPTECPYTSDALMRYMVSDKKRAGDTITLVVPYSIGDSRLYKIPLSELKEFIEKGLDVKCGQ